MKSNHTIDVNSKRIIESSCDPSSKSLEKETVCEETNVKRCYQVTLEPAVFLIFFSLYFSNVVYKSEVLRLTCERVYGYSIATCNVLVTNSATNDTRSIEEAIQPYSISILMTRTMIDNVLAAFVGLLLGAWADKFGRKPILLATSIGFSIMHGLILLLSLLQVHPWFYAIAALPAGMFGSVCSLLGATFSYITDMATPEERPFRLCIITACQAIGAFLGSFSSGYVFEITNATIIFLVSTSSALLAIVYLVLFVPESLHPEKSEASSKLRGILQFDLIKDMWTTFNKRRAESARLVIFICVLCLCAFLVTMEGSTDVMFMFFRKNFLWTTKDITTFNAVSVLTVSVGGAVGIIVFQKVLKLRMSLICLIALGFCTIDFLAKAFVQTPWQLYLVNTITMPRATYVPFVRSIIASVVSIDEIGKIFAIATAMEFMMPLAVSPIYNLVYTLTMSSMAGAYNLVSCSVYIICFALFIVVCVLEKRYSFIKYSGNK